jgi:hypothetical protein
LIEAGDVEALQAAVSEFDYRETQARKRITTSAAGS